jgi:hypothetical protein
MKEIQPFGPNQLMNMFNIANLQEKARNPTLQGNNDGLIMPFYLIL